MHASTIVAILAFTTGMIANGAPVIPSINPPTDELRKVVDGALANPKLGQLNPAKSITQLVQRDPQRRGRLGRIGDAAGGIADGIGAISDGLLIHDAIQGQNQKRDPEQPSNLGRLGGPAKTIPDATTIACDASTCVDPTMLDHNEKRDPQRRGRLGRVGDAASGIADGLGAIADVITIGSATQGQQA